jgi:hypothetical protein
VRRFKQEAYVGQLSNPLSGAVAPYKSNITTVDVYAVPGDDTSGTETTTGQDNVTLPHQGAVLLNAGRVVTAPDGTIEFQAGPSAGIAYFVNGDTSVVQEICAALA